MSATWDVVRKKVYWCSPENDGGRLAIAMLASGASPTRILVEYDIQPRIRFQDKRAIFFDLFDIPEAYAAIQDFHHRGFRMDALAALWLYEWECEHDLAPTITDLEWENGVAR
jgi:hypothetical protein